MFLSIIWFHVGEGQNLWSLPVTKLPEEPVPVQLLTHAHLARNFVPVPAQTLNTYYMLLNHLKNRFTDRILRVFVVLYHVVGVLHHFVAKAPIVDNNTRYKVVQEYSIYIFFVQVFQVRLLYLLPTKLPCVSLIGTSSGTGFYWVLLLFCIMLLVVFCIILWHYRIIYVRFLRLLYLLATKLPGEQVHVCCCFTFMSCCWW